MNVWGKVMGKRKAFLKLLCDGETPYRACRLTWPNVKDVHGHVTAIFNDHDFREAYAKLTDYQSSREQLIAGCLAIIDDSEVASDDKLAAIKVIASLRGFVQPSGRPSPKNKLRPAIEDDKVLLDKVAELAMKARDHGDHGRKAN